METLSKIKVDLIEKLTSLPYFLFLLSLALFTDTYLLAVHKTTIRQVTDAWFQSHSTFSELMTYLGCIGFFYAALIPGVQFFASFATIRFADSFPSSKDGWVEVSTLKTFAIRTKNSLAYQECEKTLAEVREIKHLEGLCLSLVILSVVGYVLSDDQNPGLFQFIYYGVESFPWYVHWPLMLLIAPFLFFVIMVAFRGGRQYDGYIHLPDFESWSKEA
jgi:hypothetical protein